MEGDLEQARDFYREALANEASCIEALYNQGNTVTYLRNNIFSSFLTMI